jgi:hypothetical protein
MKKSLVFILALASFEPMNANINFLRALDVERDYLSKQNNDELAESLLRGVFEADEEDLNKSNNTSYTYSRYITLRSVIKLGYQEYEAWIVFGVVYEKSENLAKRQKQDLIVKAQEAFKDLMNKEVFGQRVIEKGITVYCAFQRIKEVK